MCKCEHIIGLLCCYEDTQNVTLKELKSYVNANKKQYEYELSNYPRIAHKPYDLNDYIDRRKSTNLIRYNFCPHCGEKIDWKSFKEV